MSSAGYEQFPWRFELPPEFANQPHYDHQRRRFDFLTKRFVEMTNYPFKHKKPRRVLEEIEQSEDTEMEEELLVEEDERSLEEEGELPMEITENVSGKERLKDEVLADIENTNLSIEEIKEFQLIWMYLKHIFKNEDEEESKKKRNQKGENDMNFGKTTEIKQIISETKKETVKEFKSDEKLLNELEEVDEKTNKSQENSKEMMEKRVEEDLNKAKNKEPPMPVLEKISTSSSNNNSHKNFTKQKNKLVLGIIQKNGCSNKTDEIEEEKDDKEFELSDCIKHDKKYFYVPLTKISCKLCSFKGILIVHHYKTKHPESEMIISRINPNITEILIEDSVRNREKYDKNHPGRKKKYTFKCPFCLMIIKSTPNAYYNHISSHTGEYCFSCNYCSFQTYNSSKVCAHFSQTHHKIHKSEYKKLYPDLKTSKYVFGHICSECNFIQLIRETVEKHVMMYHPGTPKIHRVNLGMRLHKKVVDEVNKNHSNLNNSINTIISRGGETHNHNLKLPIEVRESDLSVQLEELEEVNVEIESKKLADNPHPIELVTFVCQPDLDIKQDSESDRTEMLQLINKQIKLVNDPVEESEKVQTENKEPKNMSEEVVKQNKEVDPLELPETPKKSVEVMEPSPNQRIEVLPQKKDNVFVSNIINRLQEKLTPLPPPMTTSQGIFPNVLEISPITVIKESNVFTFHCKVQNCNYSSKDKKVFAIHCEIVHKDFIFSMEKCNVCSIKFDYEGEFITVHDIYLHIVTVHKDFFEQKSAINFKLPHNIPNVLSQTYDNPGLEFPFIISNVTSLASKSGMNPVGSTPPLLPLLKEDKEKTLSSKVKFSVIPSVQSLKPKAKQLVLTSKDQSKYTSVLTDIPITDFEKQNRKCPKAVAVMMNPSLLNILYKCARYNCNLSELVLPYNCKDDGFPNCLFKTLHFDEYLEHVEASHPINGLSLYSSEHKSQKKMIMEVWLAKEVGPFQCKYCKKATVSHQEMERHQRALHAQEQCWFYYFVPNNTVTIPESVTSANLINEPFETVQPPVQQLPSGDPPIDPIQSTVPLDEPEIFTTLEDNKTALLSELDPLCLNDESLKDTVTITEKKSKKQQYRSRTQRTRECRTRKKAMKYPAAVGMPLPILEIADVMCPYSKSEKRQPKSGAQRTREYRLRLKASKNTGVPLPTISGEVIDISE